MMSQIRWISPVSLTRLSGELEQTEDRSDISSERSGDQDCSVGAVTPNGQAT
jgi:hypothetical protein